MPKQRVSEDEYLAQLNKHLLADSDYEEGMKFIPAPEGASGKGMNGYSMAVPFDRTVWLAVYSRAAHVVGEKFHI